MALAGCGRLSFDDAQAPPAEERLSLALDFRGRFAPSEELLDVPLLVVLDDRRARRELMQPDASDLRFYDAAGKLLPHELEQLGAPGGPPLVAWVRVPRLSGTSTKLEARYGATPEPRSTEPVWSPAFAAVWHFDERLGAPARDATEGGHHGQLLGTGLGAGFIGQARKFVAAERNAISIADSSALTFRQFTLSAWVQFSTSPGQLFYAAISRQLGDGGENELFLANFANRINSEIVTDAGGFSHNGSTLPLGQWLHLAAVYDGATLTLYLNGLRDAARPITGALARTANPIFLGADRNSASTPPGSPDDDFLDGLLDEVRLERVARSPAWMAAGDLIMRDEAITYGAAAGP